MLFVYCSCIVLCVFLQNSPLFQNLIILFTVLVCHRVRWGSLSDEPSPHLTLYKGETINFLNSTPHSIDTQTQNSPWNFNYYNFLVLLFLLIATWLLMLFVYCNCIALYVFLQNFPFFKI